MGAPDLSRVVQTLTLDSLDQVLTSGRPERGMPPPIPAFSPEEREAVIAFLEFLDARRDELEAQTQSLSVNRRFDLGSLPWWEFR